jgi:hypothetical protein
MKHRLHQIDVSVMTGASHVIPLAGFASVACAGGHTQVRIHEPRLLGDTAHVEFLMALDFGN